MNREEILKKIIMGPNGKKPLSSDQRKAVESEKRYIRILAGAGAGKTETLTRRILYLLLYKDVDPEEIVTFTFTEKAAQSIKSRIYTRVTELMGEDFASKLGKMYIGTIHGYALRILQDHFGYGNYDVLDDKQEMAFIMRRGWEIGINSRSYGEKCKKFVDAVNVIYDELIHRDELEKKNPDFYDILKRYEEQLDKYHRFTFGRLIYLALNEIKANPNNLPKIKYLIVDEYQDINHAQEELIKLLGKNANIMVVGDPRQTIYQWRGSDDQCFERFISELYPEAESIIIPENRRSGKNIVEVGNSVSERLKNRKFEPMKPTKKEKGYVYVSILETPKDEAKWVVDQIETLVKSKSLNYSDFGILLRSVDTSGEPFIQEFKRRRIPYLVGGTAGLFRREEATAVGKLFTWLYDESFWRDRRGKIEYSNLVESAIEDWERATGIILSVDREGIKEKLKKWKKDVRDSKFHNFQDAYHALLNILRFKELNPNDKLHASIMANLGRFSNLLSDYENAIRIGGNKLRWNNSNLRGLMWYFNLYATTAYEEQSGEDIRGIDSVQITTIHQAKGLEWAVVFIPALVHGRFPSSHMNEQKKWLISRTLFPADRYDSKEDDERRLFYVAVTRAKSTLVLSGFRRIRVKKSMSKFLKETLTDNPKVIQSVDPKCDRIIDVDMESSRGSENEIYTFDAGEIVDYTKCPYFYRLRYVWGYNAPLNEELGYGNALHYCLRRVVELHRKGYNPLSAILEAINNDFHLPYAPEFKAEKMKKSAERILMDYVIENLDDISSVAEVEYRLEFPRKNSTITGKVDVIIDRDEFVEVREYKTSTKVTKPDQVALQVKLYALGLGKLGYNVRKGSAVYLSEGVMEHIDVDNKSLNYAKTYAEQILTDIRNQKYEPKLGNFCEECDYRNICKWAKSGE